MLISDSCSTPDPSSAFECPTVNANSVADMALRSQAVVGTFPFALAGTAAAGRSVGLKYGDTRGPGVPLPAWLALTLAWGVGLARA
eukprot:393152-Pleurochrysis_carterae.AAC.1